MRTRVACLALWLISVGCGFDDTLPTGSRLGCDGDAECVPPLVCGADGRCRDPDANARPTVEVGPIDRLASPLRISGIVVDSEDDTVTLGATLRFEDGEERALSFEDDTVSAKRDGTAFDLLVTGGAPDVGTDHAGLVLDVSASDAGGRGRVVSTAPFRYGNTSPVLTSATVVGGVAQGLVQIALSVADTAADPVSLSSLVVSPGGAFDGDEVTIAVDDASFPLGLPSALASSADGVTLRVGWDSAVPVALQLDAPGARARVTLTDGPGLPSTEVLTAPFVIDNANLPPTVTWVDPPTTVQTGDAVPLQLLIADPDLDDRVVLTVRVRFSADGSEQLLPALSVSPTVGLDDGTHDFVWDATQLGLARFDSVELLAVVSDGPNASEEASTGIFVVDNTGFISNVPPSVVVGTVARSIGLLQIPVTLIDANGDSASLSVELSQAGVSRGVFALGSNFAASLDGTEHVLTVDPTGLLDPAAINADLVVAVTATDGTSGVAGQPRPSAAFVYGNTPPRVAGVALPDPVSALVPLTLVLEDDTADLVAVESLEVSPRGDFTDTVDVPIDGARFPLGLPDALETDPLGLVHALGWDSFTDLALDAPPGARARVRVIDGFGAVSAVTTSLPFAIDNADLPPTVSIAASPVGTIVNGTARMDLSISDPDGDSVVLFVSYLLDDGTTVPAASSSATTGLVPGPHEFIWQTSQLGFDEAFTDVRLLVRVSDGSGVSDEVASAPFSVDNTTLGGNVPPTLFVDPLVAAGGGRFTEDALVVFSTADVESDEVDVALTFSTDGVTFLPLTPANGAISLTNLAAAPGGTDHAFLWNARADLGSSSVDTDGDTVADLSILLQRNGLLLRAIATDALSGAPFVTPAFSVGDTAPTLNATPLPATVAAAVPLELTLFDAAPFDLSDVEVEFRIGAGPFKRALISLGQTTGLATSAAGQTYVLVWDTTAAPNADVTIPQGVGTALVAGVEVRARALDRPRAGLSVFGPFATAGTVTIENQTPPRLEVINVKRDGGLANGIVPITYRLIDEQGDPADLLCEVSRDLGASFFPCTEAPTMRSEGIEGLGTSSTAQGGVLHTFVWDSIADLFAPSAATLVRLTPRDADGGVGATVPVLMREAAGVPAADLATTIFPRRADHAFGGAFEAIVGITGDVDGDGIADLVAAGGSGGTACVDVFSGEGINGLWAGTFTAGATAFVMPDEDGAGPGQNIATDALLADLSCDGVDDLVVATRGFNAAPADQLFVSTADGAGNFSVPVQHTLPGDDLAPSLAIGDLDGDGRQDVVVGRQASGNNVHVFFGQGTAPACTLGARVDLAGIGFLRSIRVGDLDGDGDLEIITPHGFYRQTAPRVFAAGVGFPGASAGNPQSVDVGDVDGDGDLDVVTGSNPFGLATWRNNGAGSFGARIDSPSLTFVHRVALADTTGDGVLDVFVLEDEGSVELLRGDGAGRFARILGISDPARPATLRAPDLDTDGHADLVLFNRDLAQSAGIYVSGPRPALTLDAFAAPLENPVDLSLVGDGIFHQKNGAPGPADLDADGLLDLYGGEPGGTGFGSTAFLLRGDGAGRAPFGTFADVIATPASVFTARFVADMNDDGFVDLIGHQTPTLDNNTYPDLRTVLADAEAVTLLDGASQTFGVTADGALRSRCAAPADLNGDDRMDLLIVEKALCVVGGCTAPYLIGRYLGTGSPTGAFTKTTSSATGLVGEPTGFAAGCETGDFDADGDIDLVFGVNNALRVYLANGTAFSAGVVVPLAIAPTGIRAADLDDDGILDLLAVSSGAFTSELRVLKGGGSNGRGDGTFNIDFEQTPIAPPMTSVHLADVSADGVLDVVAGVFSSGNELQVWEGTGDRLAPFRAPLRIPVGDAAPEASAPADINGDLMPDVIAGTRVTWTTIALHQTDPRGAATRPITAFGSVVDATGNLFGRVTNAHTLLHKGIGMRDDGPGDQRRGPDALRPTFLDELRRARAVSSTTGLVPLSRALRAGGELTVVRATEPDGSTFLEVRNRLGSRTQPASRTDFSRTGLDLGAGRGVVITLPFVPGATATANVRVFMRVLDLERDPVAPSRLPQHADGRDLVREEARYVEIARDADGNLATGTGARFVVDADTRTVRALLDRLGVLQAFNAP